MKTEFSIKLIPSDFEGNVFDCKDCTGARSFKRACIKHLNILQRFNMRYSWATTINYEGWASFIGSTNVDMMREVKVGDIITFKKLEKNK